MKTWREEVKSPLIVVNMIHMEMELENISSVLFFAICWHFTLWLNMWLDFVYASWSPEIVTKYCLYSKCGVWYVSQFSSVAQSCPTFCNPMNCSTSGLPVHHQLPEFTQTHVHCVSDAIQPSHPLSSPSPPAPSPSQHQSLFQGVNSSHEVAKVLEFQL